MDPSKVRDVLSLSEDKGGAWTSPMSGSCGGNREEWAKVTSLESFMQITTTMENPSLMTMSKLIFTQSIKGGNHLVEIRDFKEA